MKIAFVFDDSLDRPDGVQQYILTVGGWLSRQGHEVHYLVGQTKRQDLANVYSLSRNIHVKFNGNNLSVPLPASRRKIKALLAQHQFDVLHVQLPCSPWLAGRVVAAAPATTRVVGTFHILPLSRVARWGARLLALVSQRTIQRLDAACSVSSAAQEYAQQVFGLSSSVVPNAVDVSYFAHAEHHKPTSGRIVFLGRLVERKGCRQLLDAIIYLQERHSGPVKEVIICGDGPLRAELEQFVQLQGLAEIVRFEGFVTEAQKRDFLASAQVAVFPSLGGESFGIVLIEAMAAEAGTVLGGNNPGYRSVLGDQPQLLVDPRDTPAFALRLAELLTDEDLQQTLHNWQVETVKKYDVATVGSELLSLYELPRPSGRQDSVKRGARSSK